MIKSHGAEMDWMPSRLLRFCLRSLEQKSCWLFSITWFLLGLGFYWLNPAQLVAGGVRAGEGAGGRAPHPPLLGSDGFGASRDRFVKEGVDGGVAIHDQLRAALLRSFGKRLVEAEGVAVLKLFVRRLLPLLECN